jgi:hypothetical protein
MLCPLSVRQSGSPWKFMTQSVRVLQCRHAGWSVSTRFSSRNVAPPHQDKQHLGDTPQSSTNLQPQAFPNHVLPFILELQQYDVLPYNSPCGG